MWSGKMHKVHILRILRGNKIIVFLFTITRAVRDDKFRKISKYF